MAFLMLPIVVLTHLKGGDLDGLDATSGDDWLVAAARLGDGAKAAQGVADHGGAGDQGAQAELFDLGLAEALDGVQLEAQRVALDGGFHRHDEGRLAGSPTAALAAATGATEIGIVHLHALVGPADGFLGLAVQHDLGQLLLDFPGGGLGYPEAAGELKARDTLLGLGDQVDGLEPDDQVQLGGMEDGAGGQGNLMAAGAALVELALLDLAASPAGAARADETFSRPTPGSQSRPALFLGAVGGAKLPFTEALLELDLVACHGELLGKARMFTFCTTPNRLRIVRNQERI